MFEYLDIRKSPVQVAIIEKTFFDALKACSGNEAVPFSIESLHYDGYIELILHLPQNRFDIQKVSIPTKLIISTMYYSSINELLNSDKFQISDCDLIPGKPTIRRITLTYFK